MSPNFPRGHSLQETRGGPECFYASQPDRGRAAQDCDRFPCRVYREGHDLGYPRGRQRGHAEGYADGYAQGYPEGMAACPRPHGGG